MVHVHVSFSWIHAYLVGSHSERRRYNQADFDLAAEMINTTYQLGLLTKFKLTISTPVAWENWHSKFMEIMQNCIPRVHGCIIKELFSPDKQTWKSIAKQNVCYYLLKSTQCDYTLHKYKSLRNKVVGLVREAKRKYLNFTDQRYSGRLLRC